MVGMQPQDVQKPETVGKPTEPPCSAVAVAAPVTLPTAQLLLLPSCELHPALLLWRAEPTSDQAQLGHFQLRAEGQALAITALPFRAREKRRRISTEISALHTEE